MKALEQELATSHAALAKAQAELEDVKLTPEQQIDKYWAAQPEAVRKRHEADELEKQDLRKRLADADARAEQTEYIAKTADFHGFGMVARHWKILKAIDRLEDDDRTELLRLMKASAKQLETSGYFNARGFEQAQGETEFADAEGHIRALAKAFQKEHGGGMGEAISAVAAENPDLWGRYQTESRRRNRGDIR